MRFMIAVLLLLGMSVPALAVTTSQTKAGDEAALAAENLMKMDEIAAVASVPAENSVTVEAKVSAEKVDNKKESEIPLNLDAPKKAAEESNPLFKLILAVSMMGVVGTGAYIFIRKYSKNSFAAGKNNQIKVLTQHFLGPKKSLAIIRVAGESILIGVTDQNITMIKSLALLDDEVPEEVSSSNFADLFGGVPAQKSNNRKAQSEQASEGDEDEEEFSIRGVKEVVSKKLKGMRSFQ